VGKIKNVCITFRHDVASTDVSQSYSRIKKSRFFLFATHCCLYRARTKLFIDIQFTFTFIIVIF